MGEHKRKTAPYVHAPLGPGDSPGCLPGQKLRVAKQAGEVTCPPCRRLLKEAWSRLSANQKQEILQKGGEE